MPTAVLLDTSLSMVRPSGGTNGPGVGAEEEQQRKHLAAHGVRILLDHLATHYRLEFTSLLAFSSVCRLIVPFTRDYSSLQEGLSTVEDQDKTCLEAALKTVSTIVQEEWGVGSICQVVLVTDGCMGIGKGSLRQSLASLGQRGDDRAFPLPFPFPSKLYVMCIATLEELAQGSLENLQWLVDRNGGHGKVFYMEGPLSTKNMQVMFSKLIEQGYSSFHTVVKCGHLASEAQLFPRPEPVLQEEEGDTRNILPEIQIVGFLDINDVCSPPVISRHLVLPIGHSKESEDGGAGGVEETDEDPSAQNAGKRPSFCVLLHGSLKVEGMVALVQLGPAWFGMLYSQADSKKKSNLMMSVFEPGFDTLPWLGKFTQLGPISDFAENPYGEDDTRTPFPMIPATKRSYAQNVVVWIKQGGLQTDVQKILRNARKLPEKTQTFYKELNRLRKAALAFGFQDLLTGVAELLERECSLLPEKTHPDAAFQLSHAAKQLRRSARPRSEHARYECTIAPLRTNFSGCSAE